MPRIRWRAYLAPIVLNRRRNCSYSSGAGMENLRIIPGRLQHDIVVTAPGELEGHIKLSIPEFYGQSGTRPFAVQQVLRWHTNGHPEQAEFTLDRPPEDVGIDCHGSATLRESGSLDLEGYVQNAQPHDIEEAHHTLHFDFSTMPDMADPDGERTYVYTNFGWISLLELLKDQEKRPKCIWVGATYGQHTVIWKTMARMTKDESLLIAVALDKGYALANDHPDWPQGLLAGCRWGTLNPNREKLFRGRVYFCKNGLDELRQRYAQDFRPG